MPLALDIDDGEASATPVRYRLGIAFCEGCCDVGCCDVRRAVIVLSLLSIVGHFIVLCFLSTTKTYAMNTYPFDDDSLDWLNQTKYQTIQSVDSSLIQAMIQQSIATISACLSMVGACTFNKWNQIR